MLYKNRHQECIARGVCASHPDIPLLNGFTRCDRCLKQRTEQQKRRHKLYKKQGKCVSCGLQDIVSGAIRCAKCRWKKNIQASAKLSIKIADDIINKQNYICPLSGRILKKGINASSDHIIHKKYGGLNTRKNIRFVDMQVNLARRDYTDEDFIKMCYEVVNHQEQLKQSK